MNDGSVRITAYGVGFVISRVVKLIPCRVTRVFKEGSVKTSGRHYLYFLHVTFIVPAYRDRVMSVARSGHPPER
jgi:hypothetical protein